MDYDLNRFILAQEEYYDIALKEMKKGRKETQWIWFIFPQIDGLGKSYYAQKYSIKSLDEAINYYENTYLRNHLLEITNVLLELSTNSLFDCMSSIDVIKINSSMTLFYLVSKNELFKKVIDKYFNGNMDIKTINIINKEGVYEKTKG